MSEMSISYSVTLHKNGVAMDYYYCSIYKNTQEGLLQFFERGVLESELPIFTIQLPTSSLADWSFGIIGFKRETGDIPLCQRAIKLQELMLSGSIFIS
ncbi:MAG: hypothetical protein K2X08_01340 [Chlamydiales bacterium]|nr:hypothetical protein [Chlamydiales bacterium]